MENEDITEVLFTPIWYQHGHGEQDGSQLCLSVGGIYWRADSRYTGFIPQLLKRYIDDVVVTSIQLSSSLQPSANWNCRTSINVDKLQTLVHYKATDRHNNLHFSSLQPDRCKGAIPYSQFLRLRRICSDYDDFINKASEMKEDFWVRGYLDKHFNNDLS